MSNLRVVKEPIHNYVSISNLESVLMRDPLLQRLHHITQNGTAYLTYPSNRTSRFVHSLGAMHIGGEMFRASLFMSDASVHQRLLVAAESVVNAGIKDLSINLEQIGQYLHTHLDPFYLSNGFTWESSERINEVVLFQSTRIACALHDVGHLPLSHTTETVLSPKLLSSPVKGSGGAEFLSFRDAIKKLRADAGGVGRQLHEDIGVAVVGHIFANIQGDQRAFAQLCFWVANRIATENLAKHDPDGIFSCLHSIVSSDGFDADRGDYVLRDGYASSFEFGEYDLARILNNLRFAYKNKRLQICSSTVAASALESFFLERYRIYRWLVFHHSVVRGEVAASRALTIMLDLYFAEKLVDELEQKIQGVLVEEKMERLWIAFSAPEKIPSYFDCDEPWLLTICHRVRSLLGNGPVTRRLAMLRACIGFVLAREKGNFVTLWKRAEQYEDFAAQVYASAEEAVQKLKPATRRKLREIKKDSSESATEWFNRVIIPFLKSGYGIGEIEAMRSLETSIQDHLGSTPGALLLKVLRFGSDVECNCTDDRGKLISIQSLSSIVENLPRTWRKDIQLRAYWVGLAEEQNGFTPAPSTQPPTSKKIGKVFLQAILGGTEQKHLLRLTH